MRNPSLLFRIVFVSGFGVILLFLLINAGIVALQFLLGVLGLKYFLWPETEVRKFFIWGEKYAKRHISLREVRRGGILVWLLLALEALLRIYELHHPHISN